jgi:hypothetical protein
MSKLDNLLKLNALLEDSNEVEFNVEKYKMKLNEKYLLESVTKYFTGIYLGNDEDFIYLKSVCWIADTGRFADAVKKEFDEVEPYHPDSICRLNRGALVNVSDLKIALPTEQK